MLSRFNSRPSPALVISLVALFVSLGGVGYAAVTVTGKNVKNGSLTGKDVKNSSLTGKDVKNSSLTGSDIKNRSLGGADIKNDGLTGTQVLESQLGEVPSANTATTAGRADSAASVDKLKTVGSYKRVTSSASDNDPNVARAAATEVPLLTFGPFDVYGKCYTDADAPATFADVFIRTHQDGSIFFGVYGNLTGSPAYLDTGTAEASRKVNGISTSANTASVFPVYTDDFFAAAPGGTSLNGNVDVAVKNGTPPAGNGLYGAGNVCIFGGDAIG